MAPMIAFINKLKEMFAQDLRRNDTLSNGIYKRKKLTIELSEEIIQSSELDVCNFYINHIFSEIQSKYMEYANVTLDAHVHHDWMRDTLTVRIIVAFLVKE